MYDVAVIGGGIIGAPTARLLAERGLRVALIASPEPTVPSLHDGPFGAHYDESRLTWLLHRDPHETRLAQQSQEVMAELEERFGGISKSQGYLFVSAPGRDEGVLELVAGAADLDFLSSDRLMAEFPMLSFPDGVEGFRERGPSGSFSPRALVAAELAMAVEAGADHIAMAAVTTSTNGAVDVALADGSDVRARKAVVAAGAFSNRPGLLPRPLALRLKQETVLMAEVAASEAERLTDYPALIYKIDAAEIGEVYSAPPIRDPDGRLYLKWGANTALDQWVNDNAGAIEWYREGVSAEAGEMIKGHMIDTIPNLAAESFDARRCVVAYTPHGRPYVDEAVPGKLYVAAGGNGHSAKWSYALGSLAASLVADGGWDDPVPRQHFELRFADEPGEWRSRDLWSARREEP